MIRAAQTVSPEEAASYFIKNYPTHALRSANANTIFSLVKSVATITRNEPKAKENQKDVTETMPFQLKHFDIPDIVTKWIKKGFFPSLILVGPAGSGKTALCIALAKYYNWKLFICNHKESLKNLNCNDQDQKYNAILYDDMSFADIDNQQLLAIFGNDSPRTIRILNQIIEKPPLIKMFTLNRNSLKEIKRKIGYEQFLRRITVVEIKESMIVNVDAEINEAVANHTDIFNNPENIANNQKILDLM